MRFFWLRFRGSCFAWKIESLSFSIIIILANSPWDMQNPPLLIPNTAALVRNLYKRSTLSHPTLGKVSIPTGTEKEKSHLGKTQVEHRHAESALWTKCVLKRQTSVSAPLVQSPLSRYHGRVHNTPAGERGHVVPLSSACPVGPGMSLRLWSRFEEAYKCPDFLKHNESKLDDC